MKKQSVSNLATISIVQSLVVRSPSLLFSNIHHCFISSHNELYFFQKSITTVFYGQQVDIFSPQHAGFDLSSTSTYTRMKLNKSGIPKKNLDKNDDFVYSIPFLKTKDITFENTTRIQVPKTVNSKFADFFLRICICELWFPCIFNMI